MIRSCDSPLSKLTGRAGLIPLGILLLALAGCGSDNKNPVTPGGNSGTTTFTGAITSATESGKIAVTVSVSSSGLSARQVSRGDRVLATATGSVTVNGAAAIALTGTYDPVDDSANLTGGGYTFIGGYDVDFTPPAITGFYNGPNGSGNFSCPVGDGTAVKVFCGTYQSTGTSTHGSWNFYISGASIVGYAWTTGETEALFLFGTVTGTGTTRTIALHADNPSLSLTATGTWDTSNNTLSAGAWSTTPPGGGSTTDSGTWTGALCP